MVGGWCEMAYPIVSEPAKVTDNRHEKNIMAPSLAGVDRLIAQRLLMGFWHASDDIVAGGRQVPRDLPSPPRGQKLSGSGALALSLLPRAVLCQINVHPVGYSVETAVSHPRFQTRYG